MLTYPKLTVHAILKTSVFGRTYLWNRSGHQQLVTNLIDCHLFPVGEKKYEFRFTNKKVRDTDVDLPKFKIRRDCGQLQNLTGNIPRADRHTENQ